MQVFVYTYLYIYEHEIYGLIIIIIVIRIHHYARERTIGMRLLRCITTTEAASEHAR